MKNQKTASIFLFLLFAVFFYSCDSNRIFEDNTKLPDYVWDVKNKVSFEVEIDDTTSFHNLYVNVRHASHYPFANLYIFANITFPNGKTRLDTVNCILQDNSGKWLGDGMGDIWDMQIMWMPKIKFPLSGKYVFEYTHGMRMEQVPFVMDVGLRVEKEKKQ